MTSFHKYALFAFAILLTGCGSKPKSVENNVSKKGAEKSSNPTLPGAVQGKGWKIRWTTQDPKDPARVVLVLIAEMEQGELFYKGKIPNLRMHNVKAQVFQEGKHSADIEAGLMEANREEQKLIGRNGVKLHTLVAPNLMQVSADKVTWNTKAHTALAEGSAHLNKAATEKTAAIVSQAPKIWMDTKTGEFRILGGTE